MLLGGNVIASFDETTVEATLCANFWNAARDAVLRLHPWNCAIKRDVLAPEVSAPAYEYSAAFPFPTDLLRLLSLDEVKDYRIERRKILCNEKVLYIRYVYRNEDTQEYDALLTEALAAYLAFKLAYPLTKSNTTKNDMWSMFTELLRTAKAVDAQEEPGQTFGDFPFISVRR